MSQTWQHLSQKTAYLMPPVHAAMSDLMVGMKVRLTRVVLMAMGSTTYMEVCLNTDIMPQVPGPGMPARLLFWH